jgi:homospermidine synthase
MANAEVGDTNVIDVIGTKPNSSEAVLLLHQMRPWNADSYELLKKKLEFYETVIVSGALARQRPDTNGKTFRIVVIYAELPPDDALQLLTQTKGRMFDSQVVLRWGLQQELVKLVAP